MSNRDKVTILIVDDQPAKLLSLEVVIAELGERIVKATSAEQALRILLHEEVAVVLVDVCMPTMDGFELAAMIRGHPRYNRTAIIFISAVHLSDADRLRGYDLGAVDYIPVPIIPEVLKAKVAVFADLHRKTDELKALNQQLEDRVAQRTADLAATNARLRYEEQRYRQLVSAVPAGIYSCDAKGRITLFNKAAADLWGREPAVGEELYCGSYKAFTAEGHPQVLEQSPMAVTLREGRAVRGGDIIFERPDGSRRTATTVTDPIFDEDGALVGAINLLTDVTEQRAAETMRAHLALIVQSTDDAVVSKNLDGIIQSWNPAAERLYGYTAEEAVGRSIMMLIPPERNDEELDILTRIRSGKRIEHFETVRVAKGGRRIHVSITVSPVRDATGRVVGASKIAKDVSEARAAARERDRLLAVMEATPDLVATADAGGGLLYLNPVGRRVMGLTALQPLAGLQLTDLYLPESAELIRRTAMPAAVRDRTWEGEMLVQPKDGAPIPVSQVLIAHTGHTGEVEVFSIVARDITERRRAEAVLARDRETLERLVAERTEELERTNERLRMNDRMATIGTLSAGLGHDMGNLLMPLRMRLEAMEGLELPPQAQDDLSAVRKAADYLQQLARSLRMLAIDPERETASDASTDLAGWWADTEPMHRNGVQHPTLLSADIPKSLPPVRLGRAALTQVVFNLIQNAGDILRRRDDGRVHVRAQAVGDGVRIIVTDNGPGMSEETRRRCTEPFFTTKTRGMSTGLGLSLVSGLVSNAGGSIQIESSPGKGTVFAVTLPAAPRASERADQPAPSAGVAVVTVQDARLAAHVVSVLTAMNYTTLKAGEPTENAELWIAAGADGALDERAAAFVEARPGRRAVLFVPGATKGAPGGGGGGGGGRSVVWMDPRTPPSELRVQLRAVLSEPVVSAVGGGA
ncbi:MAG: PAS domain S-box protein [Phycisphaerales bacterium]